MQTIIKYAIAILLSYLLSFLGFTFIAKTVAFLATALLLLVILAWLLIFFSIVIDEINKNK